MVKRPVVFTSLSLVIILVISCLPKARTGSRPSSQASEDEKLILPVDRSEWTWVDRQGKIRTFAYAQKALLEIMKENGISGLSIVLKQGENWSNNPSVYTFDLGVEDPETRKSIDAMTVFQADRLGQPVVAYIVMMLVTRKQFDLDRPLYKYLPKSAIDNSPYQDVQRDPRYKRLTARRILSHQSGLANSRLTLPEKKLTFVASPGKGFRYSDEGYGFLQYVLEQKFGRSLNDLAKYLVYDPLDMRRTSFIREPRFEGHIATAQGGGPCENSPSSPMPRAFYTNASDYTRFIWTARTENPYLSYETFMPFIIYSEVLIRSPSILEHPRSGGSPTLPPKLAWCLGWGTYQIPRVILGACSFIGQRNHGMESYATIYESQKSTAITIFVALNSQKSGTPRILRGLLGEMETPLSWLGF
jgi:CubicO group peptidase (beta-lactamase class C family)